MLPFIRKISRASLELALHHFSDTSEPCIKTTILNITSFLTFFSFHRASTVKSCALKIINETLPHRVVLVAPSTERSISRSLSRPETLQTPRFFLTRRTSLIYDYSETAHKIWNFFLNHQQKEKKGE